MTEAQYQRKLIEKIELMFPGVIVIKNDPTYIQGFPDLTVFYQDKYVMLETKISEDAPHQPNQDWYINYFSQFTVSRFIWPEIEEEVLDAVQFAFRT